MILENNRYKNLNEINLGCGREQCTKMVNIDLVQYIANNKKMVDVVMDIEKERLPFDDSTIKRIVANNVFEHLGEGFIFALNECYRVLKEDGILKGCVPRAGSKKDFMDITHKRHFIRESFGYLCGENLVKSNRPKHPKYADYGVFPWNGYKIEEKDDMIYFELKPRKIYGME